MVGGKVRAGALVCVTVVASALGTVPARAENLVTWIATGTLDRVDFDLAGTGVSVGDPFTVRATFDADAADRSAADPTRGDYADLVASVEITVDGGTDGIFTWTATPSSGTFLSPSSSVVFDDWLGPTGNDPPEDRWWLQSNTGWAGPTLGVYSIHFIQRFLDLFDPDGTAFDSDALPTSPPSLVPFDAATFTLAFRDEDSFTQWIEGPITSLTTEGSGTPVHADVTESIAVTDTVQVLIASEISISDAISVSDTVEILIQAEVPVAEPIAVTDTIQILVGLDLPVAEPIGVTDTVHILVAATAPVAEPITVTDTVQILVAFDLPVAEPIAVTDTVHIQVNPSVDLPETIGVTDTVTISVGLTISDGGLFDEDGNPRTTFFAGDAVELTGGGFAPDTSVDIELRSDPILLGQTIADGAGAIDVMVTLPTDVAYGDHVLAAVGVGSNGVPHEVQAALTLLDPSPVITGMGEVAPVQYSDGLEPVWLAFEDPNSSAADLSVEVSGLPEGIDVVTFGCTSPEGTTICEAELGGHVTDAAGTYAGQITISDGTWDATVVVIVTVEVEDARIVLASGNPVAVAVDPSTGISGPVALDVSVQEQVPDEGFIPGPADVSLAETSVVLVPLGPGPVVNAACERNMTSRSLQLACMVDGVGVGTYAVEARAGGSYLAGIDENVLTIYDPSLGFTTGGGGFIWPGTTTQECDGDQTTFGFTMEHNKKGKNVQGSLLVVRHLCEGGIIRVRSNALSGLAVGADGDRSWASFTGRATFLAPWLAQEEGNYSFTAFVEDGDPDRFWIEVHDREGRFVEAASLPRAPTDNAVAITFGDIVVPLERRGGGKPR